MGRIHVLDPHVVNQIAAGEVIERPASVVKELVENALDAGARRIDVRVGDGGRALIEVADDGWGMDEQDLARAFLPHATSKVESVDDLLHVGSLGFRGEALASVGSVARVRITSRPSGAEAGWVVEDFEGDVRSPTPAASSPGTVVRVEGLFAKVPARRKFLRTAATELGHVTTLLGRFAVAFPEVAFRLVQGTRTLRDTPAGSDRRARIGGVHGDDLAASLLEVRGEHLGFHLEGWVGPPSVHRGDARLEQVFVGGRFVRDRTVSHAVRQAYADLLPPGNRRPVAFLFLTCDPSQVDVNVHPAKAEVRWRDGSTVHRLVQRILREALEGAPPGVSVPLESSHPRPSTAEAVEFAFTHGVGRASPAFSSAPTPGAGRVAEGPPGAGPSGSGPAESPPARRTGEGLRPVGQVLGTYLVLEGDGEVVLVDQHALHERILFEEISARLREAGALEVQRLLVPVVVSLGHAEAALVREQAETLRTLGWIVEPFGEDAVAIQGLPAVLSRPDPEAMLAEVLEVLARGAAEGLDRASLVKETVDRMACRSAVMAGDVLRDEEVLALLERAEALDHSHSCPHGRPTRLTLSRGLLERWFHRTV